MCEELGIKYEPEASNDHEANGLVDRENRALRSFFRRVRSVDHKATIEDIRREATLGKKICKGKKLPHRSSYSMVASR